MFAALSSKRRAHLGKALLAACRRGLPDTRDADYDLGAVMRPTPNSYRDAERHHRSTSSPDAAARHA
jgi:hypothetical protein